MSARRRPSATFNLKVSDGINNEESIELLADANSNSRGAHHERERERDGKKSHGNASKWLRPLSLAFAVLLLASIAIASSSTLSRSHSFSSALSFLHHNDGESGRPEKMLGIELHPEDHVFRQRRTITHHWTITSGLRSPDGVKKEVYLVNGQFPGPTIECRSGDRLAIHVTNGLSSDGVSIHWHGLHMRNANAMDGAVGFTQCAIPAGQDFTYEFDVDREQSGTFWWHAHSQVQRGDGMYGGLIVHRPGAMGSEIGKYRYEKEVMLLISDWYHRSTEEVLAWYTSARGFGNEVRDISIFSYYYHRYIVY